MFVSPRGPLFQTTRSFSQRLLQHSYVVPRNTRGNLPVYTDIRNGGTRYLVLISNVGGNADQLARDLTESLFERDSPESQRMNIEVARGQNFIITGGRWRSHVMEWLKARGF